MGTAEVLPKCLALIATRKRGAGQSVAWTYGNSGFVFLILLQQEDFQKPGWERGEPGGPKEGG